MLPYWIYKIFGYPGYPTEDRKQFNPFCTLNGVYLSAMLTLHVYWLYLFLKILKKYVVGGVVVDYQNQLEKTKKAEEPVEETTPTPDTKKND